MSFIDYFGLITDPRKDINVKHDLLDVIFLTITGVFSGCEGWKDIYEMKWTRPIYQTASIFCAIIKCT